MIATALTFSFGVLLAVFAALLLAPVLWRKAQRLAWREFEATIPTTANELRAEADQVRAEAALWIRRQEVLLGEREARAARERAEAGRIAIENAQLRSRSRTADERASEADRQAREIETRLRRIEDENDGLRAALESTRHDLSLRVEEMDALAGRYRELGGIAEERKVQLAAAEAKIERLSDTLRATEKRGRDLQNTIERTRSETATMDGQLQREKDQTTALNERLSRITARLADREDEIAAFKRRQAVSLADAPIAPPAAAPTAAALAAKPGQPSKPGVVPHEAPAREAKPNAATAVAPAQTRPDFAFEPILPDMSEGEIRQRISDIAARVIRITAEAEGPDSEALRLIEAAPVSPKGADEASASLADRVRQLMREDGRAGPVTRQAGGARE
ncbi:hypothetical protein NPA31_018225 [Aurantimonas sp. MSK8Z-1]|uniref:hypothetical protein n=1 Tax=Mangrovibrevibacter kandeliae TaxID=2968473 RepID=UPI002232AE2B|nr:hypothetical protein [Aurantimonas sp. MSK8Z-1]MCW4116900.1 hypothetical protein [Aurantimonas sp. MSK8Z-1]